MTSDKIAENILAALDDLQREQERLLGEMRYAQVGDKAISVESASALPVFGESDIDKLIYELEQDLGIDLNMPPKTASAHMYSPQNEYTAALQGGLPSFPDISVFDPPEHVKHRAISGKRNCRLRKFISAAVFYGILILIIGGAFLVSQGDKKPVLGYSFMNVLTWSMQSEIPQGSMIAIKKVDPGTIKIGDDITYMKDAETSVTHRVIGITENFEGSGERGFETQGIENDSPDFEIVSAINVVGVVKLHIPKLGSWLQWLRSNLVLTLLFTAGFILLIVLLKGAFKKAPEKNKKRPAKAARILSAH